MTRVPAAGLLAAVLCLVGCSDDAADGPTSSPTSTPTSAPTSTPIGSPTAPAPSPTAEREPARYRPAPSEIDAAAKRVAARAVEALPAVERVTFTQYFGYAPPAASILVEADFAAGRGTTYDVQLTQDGGAWRVDSVESAAPVRALPDPGPLAREVLDSDRIALPWAGRRDVAAGRMADIVLRSMLAVAEEHRIGISVLVSAHPVQVFGTDRRSNHPDGLAYDIGRIDGRLVVDPGAAGLVREVMRAASGTGAYQVGGPEDLDDAGSSYFSDPTHSDHVHVGFSG